MPAVAASGSAVLEIDDKKMKAGITLLMTKRCLPWKIFAAFVTGTCLVIVNSCSTINSSRVLVRVPFCPQEEYMCGVSSLEMILMFHDKEINRDEIITDVHIPALHGTTPFLIAEYARKKELNALVLTGDLFKLLELLKNNTPPIVFLGPGKPDTTGHFAVVTGISTNLETIRIHSGRQADNWTKTIDFINQWKAGRFTTIVISKPSTQ